MSVLTNTEDESGDMLDMADKNSDDEIVPVRCYCFRAAVSLFFDVRH